VQNGNERGVNGAQTQKNRKKRKRTGGTRCNTRKLKTEIHNKFPSPWVQKRKTRFFHSAKRKKWQKKSYWLIMW